MKKAFKITSIVLTTLFFLLAFYIIIFGTIAIRNNRLLSLFGYSYSIVASPSMEGEREDALFVGDIILIKPQVYETLEIDQIIVYYQASSQKHIVHRIVEITEEGLITRGDANSQNDSDPVTEAMYVGTVFMSFAFLNIGQATLNYRHIIFVLITILFLFIIIKELLNIIKALKEKEKARLDERLETERKALYEAQKEALKKEIEAENQNEN